ncbi:hypothetical protein D5F01_LYC02121 [Larimichthys crocea]|uniref:Uncharacterized protein n=1 Tax=Larimichthys crocea TaxID=215358 RepID=A0A6G0J7I9_LARCR|nr:hypothetical protein D5F01_LYC02121 [Larimichthys crocea]
MLQLFESEGQKWTKAAKEKKEKEMVDLANITKQTEKLMVEVNTPFTHTALEKKPPPYDKKVEFQEIYPQLPVMSQDGGYQIMDDEDRIIETGRADTLIRMYPSAKSKKTTLQRETKGASRYRKTQVGDDTDQSDSEGNLGGYSSAVRRILARAERKGDKKPRKKALEKEEDDSNRSDEGDSDDGWGKKGASASRGFYPRSSSTGMEKDRQRAVKGIEESIEECISDLLGTSNLEHQRVLGKRLDELQISKRELKASATPRYALRPRKDETEKICPVVIRGQNLEYKPWQSSDMSDILEKLPTLQDGAHPWISKLEEIMVGTHMAVGDIKKLLASLLGIAGMEELLQKAGLNRQFLVSNKPGEDEAEEVLEEAEVAALIHIFSSLLMYVIIVDSRVILLVSVTGKESITEAISEEAFGVQHDLPGDR